MATKKQTYWQSIIDQWQQSGLKQSDFCNENNLNVKAFYNWKSLLRKKTSPGAPVISRQVGTKSAFLKMDIDSSTVNSTLKVKPITLRIGSVELDIDEDTDKGLALAWISILSSGLSA